MHTALRGLKGVTGWWKALLALFFCCHCCAQSTSYNFRHLTTNDGLSNGIIKSVAQDKYGYVWIATASGVCLYNGYTVKVFLHADKEALSTPDNAPFYIVCDSDKNIWVSFENGLYRYNYSSGGFILQPQTSGITITKMVAGGTGILYCITRNGLRLFHTADGRFNMPGSNDSSLLQRRTTDIFISKKGLVYLAADTGLIIYKPLLQSAWLQVIAPVANGPVGRLTADNKDNLWMSYGKDNNLVLQTDFSFRSYHVYNNFLYGRSNMTGSQITSLFADNRNRVWAATSRAGMWQYDSSKKSFINFLHDAQQPMSLSSSFITTIFQDKEGFIWMGTGGYGLNYFDPDHNFFHAIMPDNDLPYALSDHWYRAAAEDAGGNLWMGSMNGVLRYDKGAGTYTIWKNKGGDSDQLYSNSIRALLYDDHGYIWIGTAEGLNRYNPSTKHMDFFSDKDAMPRSFCWSLLQDHSGTIWIGCREGLYSFNYATHTFGHFINDPLLYPYNNYNVLCLFEDSRRRMWLGTFNKGIIMLDIKNNTVRHWMKDSSHPAFISNNIKSFTEDKGGTIWIATNDGLAAYTGGDTFIKYQQEQGLKTLNTCALQTDSHNRIWIGSGNGLFVLDSARRQFTSFTVKDGLPAAEFNEQTAFKTRSGNFIYPTLQGFITFNPEEYKEDHSGRSVYLSGVNVFNKKFLTPVNPEELQELRLAADQNFFSVELASPNYSSPQRTWFAYKLAPFDKDWIYTKDRLANYTNVPGGKYVFHYKATANKDNWNVAEKTLLIHVATVFYNTTVFRLLVLLLFVGLVYAVYRYRIQQREKIFALQSKAQLLEKEKTVVQYENLKQQLNPHFLFNSLTSLRSLIRIDRQTAADFLDKISANYRYILKSSESELVPLKDELIFAKTYIELQQTRFGKGLCVNIEADEEQLYKKIVPVTIQNLIDNAIKHNSLDAEEPLIIRLFTADNYLVVANNLQVKENVETSNSHGLRYLISLYKYLDKRPLLINKNETHFSVKIPLI